MYTIKGSTIIYHSREDAILQAELILKREQRKKIENILIEMEWKDYGVRGETHCKCEIKNYLSMKDLYDVKHILEKGVAPESIIQKIEHE